MVNSVLNVAITKNFHRHENWPTDDEVWEKQLHVVWFIWSGFLARNTHHLAFLSALPYATKALIFVHWIILEGVEQWTDLLSQVYFITFQKLSPTQAILKKMGLPSRILKWKEVVWETSLSNSSDWTHLIPNDEIRVLEQIKHG